MSLAGIGLGEDQGDVGDVAHRDPHLVAADRPARVGLRGAGAEARRVRPGVGLREGEAAERLSRAQAWEPLALLLLGAPALDRSGDERGLHRDDRPRGRVGAPDLLHDQRVAQVVEAAAAVLLGDRCAEVAHLAEHRGELAVEAAGAVVLADARRDLLVGEVPRRLGDQALLVCQLEVQLGFSSRRRRRARDRGSRRTPRRLPGWWGRDILATLSHLPPRWPGPPEPSRRGRPRSRPRGPRAGRRPPRRRAHGPAGRG